MLPQYAYPPLERLETLSCIMSLRFLLAVDTCQGCADADCDCEYGVEASGEELAVFQDV
jgi:hypothetical protein